MAGRQYPLTSVQVPRLMPSGREDPCLTVVTEPLRGVSGQQQNAQRHCGKGGLGNPPETCRK